MTMQASRLKRGVSNIHSITRNNSSNHRHRYHNHYNRSNNNNNGYLNWFGGVSSMVFGAAMVRYMEPKTTTTFSERFETVNGEQLDIIYTGYHKWRSMGDKGYVFMNEVTRTFKPHFSYAVYRKKYTMDEALAFERKNLNVDSYEIITTNDFPFHYNRAKKKREEELKKIQDDRWEKASDQERRIIYDEIQEQKKRQRILKDMRYIYHYIETMYEKITEISFCFVIIILRRRRRGTNPKAKEAREGFLTEISEKKLADQETKEAEDYLANRDKYKQSEMMLELMETDEAMNNLYIIHLKFLMDWTFPDLLFVLINAWNDFGLFNYSTHTQQTLSSIKLYECMEDITKIHDGDEVLVVINEPNHELKIYFKDNFIPIGYDGSSKHISQKNKQKQAVAYEKWIQHCDNQPFQEILSLKTDLLNECFKVFFLQNSKTCKITTPKLCEIMDTTDDFNRIVRKYGL